MFTKSKIKIPISISVFGYENKEKYPIYVWKKCCKEKHVDLLLIGEGEKSNMFWSMIFIDSCMIIYYILEENIFVVVVKINGKKQLRCLRKMNMLDSKTLKEK